VVLACVSGVCVVVSLVRCVNGAGAGAVVLRWPAIDEQVR